MYKSTGFVLVRNTVFNFLTGVAVSVVALLAIPPIVRGMGEQTFGLLILMWMVVGYLSVLDLGVGQASVKFLAEHVARDETEKVNATIWASIGTSVIVGFLIAGLMVLTTPLILDHILNVPIGFQAEARLPFYVVIIAIPFVMLQGALRSVPMAMHRFDLVNLVQGMSGVAQWGGSFVLVILGKGLLEVVILTVAIRILGAIYSYWITIRLFPSLSLMRAQNVVATSITLMKFGGWLTISQIVTPVVRYLDRVFVASFHSLTMFTFYSVPHEALLKVQAIPMSLSTTLFPAMSERGANEDGGKAALAVLFVRSLNSIFLTMLPISIVLVVFSSQILDVWLGGEFPTVSNDVFKLISVSTFFVAVANVAVATLMALGKPDMMAKLYILEIPLYVVLCLLLIPSYGIEGAAWSWLIRVILITTAFLWLTHRYLKHDDATFKYGSGLWRGLALNGALVLLLLLIAHSFHQILYQAVLICVALTLYGVGAWHYCLEVREKQIVLGLLSRRQNHAA